MSYTLFLFLAVHNNIAIFGLSGFSRLAEEMSEYSVIFAK